MRITQGDKLYDFTGLAGVQAVSKRLKDAIEDIEPGVHQFVPVEVFHKDGTPYGEPFWFFTICSCLDVINPALGGMKKHFLTAYPDKKPDAYHWGIARGRKNLAVQKDKVAGRSAWRDRRYITGYFFSDALVARMDAEGMEGWVADDVWQEV
ncbi:MAG: hypothetical protein GY742_19870 [Hyphomicrobiales bacterium]|nr:hypothetical protein [Hyphomicrobiales bacterium]